MGGDINKFEDFQYADFAKTFLEEYLENGFATMPKREIDLLILRLLIEHINGWSWDDPPSAFTLAQVLRVKRGRLRSMLDEISFRNAADEDKVKARLHKLLEAGEQDIDGNKVRVKQNHYPCNSQISCI